MQSILFCRDGLSQIYSWTDLQEFRKKKTAGEPGHPVKSIKCVVLWGELYIMNYSTLCQLTKCGAHLYIAILSPIEGAVRCD